MASWDHDATRLTLLRKPAEPLDEPVMREALTGVHDELPPPMPARMQKQDLEQLMTLLYRATGECALRGISPATYESALGLTSALLLTADKSA